MRAVGEAAAGQLEQPSSSNGGGSSSSGGGSSRQDPRLEGLPPPMVPGNTELTTISCAIQASLFKEGRIGVGGARKR